MKWSMAGLLLAALLQFASLNIHRGDLTGPFLVGSYGEVDGCRWPVEVSATADSPGYDGQFLLALAFDPTLEAGTRACLDEPSYRARRILLPLLAYATVLGWAPGIAAAFLFWNAVLTALGTWAAARWLVLHGHSPAWSLCYPLSLGVVTSLWRGLGDVALVSLLLLGFVALRGGRWGLASLSFGAALLAKETALLAILGAAGAAVHHRNWKGVRACALALVPALIWWFYVWQVTDSPDAGLMTVNWDWPGAGIRDAVSAWLASDRSALRIAKDLAVAAVYLGAGLAGMALPRSAAGTVSAASDGLRLSLAAFAVLGFFLSAAVWGEIWAFSRVLSPVVVLGAFWQWQHPTRPFGPGALPLYLSAGLGATLAIYWTVTASP